MFYITLPSNASMDIYPNNKISHYYTQLPQEINLQGDGEYEAALVEINYVHSFYNVQPEEVWLHYRFDGQSYNLALGAGYYKPENLIVSLNELIYSLAEHSARDALKFHFEPINQKAVVHLKHENSMLTISERLQKVLQLADRTMRGEGAFYSQGAVLLNDTLSCMYVYSDIVKERAVGDKLVSLLRIVPIVGKEGHVIYKSFSLPHYIPLSRQQFRTVEIVVTDDAGRPMRFESGRVVVTLHFRRRQL